jgi:hypothetical protein
MGISPSASRVAWYRFRCTLRARWSGYLALALLLGLIGGLAIGSVAAARRTEGAYPAYLAATNPSDLTVLTAASFSPQVPGYDPGLIAKIAALPGVRHVASYANVNVAILGLNGAPVAAPFVAGPLPGSVDGEYFTTDKVTVVQGRLPDPSRPDEIAIDVKGTPSQVRVGTTADLGFYTNAHLMDLYDGKTVKPDFRQKITVVGAVVYSAEQTQDDIDTQRDGGTLFTPALTRKLLKCCVGSTETAIQLTADGPGPGGTAGPAAIAAAEARIQQALPPEFPVFFYVTADTAGKAQRAIAPTTIALAAFGALAALAALLLGGQLIGRQLRHGAGDRAVLRALGASRLAIVADALPGTCAAIVAGALLACVVAVALSPVAPLGSVRQVYPHRGVAFDWPALGAGAGLLVAVSCLVAVTIAWRQARRLGAPPTGEARPGLGASVARAARAGGLPVAAAEGIRLALDPGERDSVPLRSVIFGTGLAVMVAMATVTFGASLTRLVSNPALYGWNWTFSLSSGDQTFIDAGQAARVLGPDPAVAAWTGVWYDTASIDGQTVPVLGMSSHATVTPPVLSGHRLAAPDQVVLGAATLAALHKHVGDRVTVSDGRTRSFSLRIVGTATLPSLGVQVTMHTEMGSGAILDFQDLGASPKQPSEILVSLRPGADVTAAKARLQRLVPADQGGVVSGVQRPAEITDYQAMGIAPALLAGALALGAVGSLWLTLMASVRRRRRSLALLKTLGFTRRQLAAAVTWQSVTAVLVGVIPGVPLGIALGRVLWDAFARQISVVPAPAVPVPTVALIVISALAFAALVAIWPGRVAGRTPAATLLRAE